MQLIAILLALAAMTVALFALVRISALGQELKKPAPATNPQPAPTPAPLAMTTTSAAPEAVSIPPEIVAVIAAAVAACAGRNIRIVSIRPSNSSWERAGRQSVLTSHRIR